MSIGLNIRRLRESHRLTQKELGTIAGVTDKAVSTWEKGLKEPRLCALQQLADYFGLPLSALLDEAPPPDPYFARTLDRLLAAWDRSPATVSRQTGLSVGRLTVLRRGDSLPTEEELTRLEGYFRTTLRPHAPETTNVLPFAPSGGTPIPILGRIPAGIPIPAVTDVLGYLNGIPDNGHDRFALRVSGDSMVPEYRDGDVVVIQVQSTAHSGADVVAYIGEEDATLKRLVYTSDGLELRPLNPAYDVRHFTAEQVAALPVTIGGMVVGLWRHFGA